MEDQKRNWEKIKTSNAVAVVIVTFCLLFPFSLLIWEVPTANKDIFNFLTGSIFGTGFSGAIYYLFEYKKTKDEKNETL